MQRVAVIILGAGGVGAALVRQIVAGRAAVAARAGVHFDVVALADSRHWLWQASGLSDAELAAALAAKAAGTSIGPARPEPVAMLDTVAAAGRRRAIFVDVTAGDGLEPALDRALELDFGVVLANKKALAGPWVTAHRYFGEPRLRHESTVGGGQPVIATMNYLLDTNDPIYEVEGQLSGTLGYICARLDGGDPFATALAAAKAQGFTEPDPREDLSGQDVMRKVLILGRLAGWPLEAADIQVESLYPATMQALSVADFMAAAPGLDAAMAARVAAAAARGEVLRYVGVVGPDGGRVGLQPIPAGSPLAGLKYIRFRTGRYNDEPLLIGGKGAGVEMTAAGVHGDMIELARRPADSA